MRFRTSSEKIDDWIAAKPYDQKWFAWHPVEVQDGSVVWLENVRRERYWAYDFYGKKKCYLYERIEEDGE